MATSTETETRPAHSPEAESRAALRWSRALFLTAAFASFVASVVLWFGGDRERGLFVGLWVPSILSAGTLLLGTGTGSDRHE